MGRSERGDYGKGKTSEWGDYIHGPTTATTEFGARFFGLGVATSATDSLTSLADSTLTGVGKIVSESFGAITETATRTVKRLLGLSDVFGAISETITRNSRTSLTAKDSLPPIWASNFLWGNSAWAPQTKYGSQRWGGYKYGSSAASDVATRVVTVTLGPISDILPGWGEVASLGGVVIRTVTDILPAFTETAFKTAYRAVSDTLNNLSDLAGYILIPAGALGPFMTDVGRRIKRNLTDVGRFSAMHNTDTGVWVADSGSSGTHNVVNSVTASDDLGVIRSLVDLAHKTFLFNVFDNLPPFSELMSVVLVVAIGVPVALFTETATLIFNTRTEIGEWANLHTTAGGAWVRSTLSTNTKNYMEAVDNLSVSDVVTRLRGAIRSIIDTLPTLSDLALNTKLRTAVDALAGLSDSALSNLAFLRNAADNVFNISEAISRLAHTAMSIVDIFPALKEGGSSSYPAPVAAVYASHLGPVIKTTRRIFTALTRGRSLGLEVTRRVFSLTARGNNRDGQLDTRPKIFEMFPNETPVMEIDVSSMLNLALLSWGDLKWGTTFKWGAGSQEKISAIVSAKLYNSVTNALVYDIPISPGDGFAWGTTQWGHGVLGQAVSHTSSRIRVTIPGYKLYTGQTYTLVTVFTIDGVRNLTVKSTVKVIEQAGINN